MRRTVAPLLACLLLVQSLIVVMVVPAPSTSEPTETVIAAREHVVWADGGRNLTGKVTIYGTLTVTDYELSFQLDNDAEASFWVMDGGLLEFDNVTLAPANASASHRFLFKVEGRFVARDSFIEHLTGEFISGGGIKCVNGEVELHNTTIAGSEVQGVSVEGNRGTALLDHCNISVVEYGVHVKDGARATLRNGTYVELFTHAGVLVNIGTVDISNCTFMGDRTEGSVGIAVRGGTLVRVADSLIHECHDDGIVLEDETSAGLYNNEIYNCTVGVRMSASSAEIVGCDVHDCLDGLNIYQSDPKVRRCVLTGNYNGVASKDCTSGYSLEECIIGGNSQYGVYAIGKGLSETGTTWTNGTGSANAIARIIQWWELDVNVSDHQDFPIIGAEVSVFAANGSRVYNWTTDSRGVVEDIELEGHRVLNDGTKVAQERYRVEIVKGDRTAKKAILMDQGKVLTVFLGDSGEEPTSSSRWFIVVLIFIVIIAALGYWWYRIR